MPPRILLINPNTNPATTRMMVAIAREAADGAAEILGTTARRGPMTILDPEALAAAADEVVETALTREEACAGLIVAAFGDPGLAVVRARCRIPAVGIAEASILEAARDGRRFGIATTTPGLARQIDARVGDLGLTPLYAGLRLAGGDPHDLMADPDRLRSALAEAVQASIEQDGSAAVVIGGGPLGDAARALQPLFRTPVVAPIPASVRRILSQIH